MGPITDVSDEFVPPEPDTTLDGVEPVQSVACSHCEAKPGEDCTGPGSGWHLSRFDRLHDTLARAANTSDDIDTP